ncbi:MAG TPA: hypothetical protein VEW25_14290 [Allosphingosinicella sp.]|nr:hypothetical protein [Allosphingosinicella sp.]
MRSVIIKGAIFDGEIILERAIRLGVQIEGITQSVADGRFEAAANLRNKVLAALGRDTKQRWATYFLHPDGGITDRLTTEKSAHHALSDVERIAIPIEVVRSDLGQMEEIGLLWGGDDGGYALSVSGIRFVRLYGFPRWITRRRAWIGLVGAGGYVLFGLSIAADYFGVLGCLA